MEMDRPTAADYAQADITEATQSLAEQSAKLRVTEGKLALAELKLTALGFLAEEMEQDIYRDTYRDREVAHIAAHRILRTILGVGSVAEFLALRQTV